MSIVELAEGRPGRVALVRETEDSDVKPGMVAAGGGRKGKRTEYRCAACGYGIVVYEAATLNSAWKRCANTMTRPSRVGSSRAAKLAASVEKSIAKGDHWCRSQCS
jgi:shikimate kinase